MLRLLIAVSSVVLLSETAWAQSFSDSVSAPSNSVISDDDETKLKSLGQELSYLRSQIAAQPACQKALEQSDMMRPKATAEALVQPADPGNHLKSLEAEVTRLRSQIAQEPACQSIQMAPVSQTPTVVPLVPDAAARLEKLEQELVAVRSRLEAEIDRYNALTAEVAELRQEITGVASTPQSIPTPPQANVVAAPASPQIVHTPGSGITITIGKNTLNLGAEVSLLSSVSTRRPITPANPLLLTPTDPDATFDMTARQSKFRVAYSGPQIGDFTVGANAFFTLSDSLTAEGYSFSPLVAYADLTSSQWRLAVGLQYDVFTPRDPRMIPSSLLALSGNPGAYRAQARVEHFILPSDDFQTTLQFAVSTPISTSLGDLPTIGNFRLVEDNGLPNLEARINFGIGKVRPLAGGRNLRPFEFGISGVYGQLRTIEANQQGQVNRRAVIDVWGVGADTHIAFSDRFGFSGEFYLGQSLGEYLAGINQNFNSTTLDPVPTLGGWGELYYYLTDNLHWHVGYGIDTANDSDLIRQNQTIFSNLIWNLTPQLQLSFEVDYRFTDYVPFGRKDGFVFLTEFLWRL